MADYEDYTPPDRSKEDTGAERRGEKACKKRKAEALLTSDSTNNTGANRLRGQLYGMSKGAARDALFQTRLDPKADTHLGYLQDMAREELKYETNSGNIKTHLDLAQRLVHFLVNVEVGLPIDRDIEPNANRAKRPCWRTETVEKGHEALQTVRERLEEFFGRHADRLESWGYL